MKGIWLVAMLVAMLVVFGLVVLGLYFFVYESSRCGDNYDYRFACEKDSDCDILMTDCSGCSCDYIAVNKNQREDFQRELCEGVVYEVACDLECLLSAPICVNGLCEV